MFYQTLGTLSTILESWLLYFLLAVFAGKRRKEFYLYPILICIDSAIALIFSQVIHVVPAAFIAVIMYEMMVSCLAYKSTMKIKIVIILLYNSMLSVIDMIVYFVAVTAFNIEFDRLYNVNLVNSILSILSKLILTVLVIYFTYKTKKGIEELSGKNMLLFYAVSAFTILFLTFMLDYSVSLKLSSGREVLFYILLFSILFLNVYVIYFYKNILDYEETKKKLYALKQQVSFQNRTEQEYKMAAVIKHDCEKHLHIITSLLETGEINKLKEYLKIVNKGMDEYNIDVYTRNAIIDSVLSEYQAIARKKNIAFYVAAEEVNLEALNPVYLGTLFGNILANAVEACERYLKIKNTYGCVKVEIYKKDKDVLISITNSSLEPKKISKRHGPLIKIGNHGIGIKSIEAVVEKMNGICTFGYEKGIFSFLAKIPIARI
ncbi:sensor histidine kinase [Anaeromicropila populeti]|uniref:GHKL domain-containing protein n=1 Tax=Anaeromicropila populeti TaxID=37658 RepID=A0A1I6KA61_9FIRM|nr:GHKL domain-containing protein [Anaeromicropila populeti]SFR87928.1 GHKL domain-containing protein [Anaeromicropila populeti]